MLSKMEQVLGFITPNHAELSKYELLEKTLDHLAVWQMQATVHKWFNDPKDEISKLLKAGARIIDVPKPDEVLIGASNLLMYGGASCLWECLMGNGTTTAGQSLTYFSN